MAHFKIGFDELNSLISHATAITSDSSLRDADKAMVFHLAEGVGKMSARNSEMFVRIAFDPIEVIKEGNLQVSSSELNKILSNLTDLSRTKVESIELKASNQKVQIIVHEVALEEGDEAFAGDTSYSLDNLIIRDKVLQEMGYQVEDGIGDLIPSGDLEVILSALMPVMDSKKGVNNNLINFVEDQVFVIDSRSQTFWKNILPEVFQNASLRYSTVAYLRKLNADLYATMVDNKIYVRNEDTTVEAFINHLGVRFNYKPTLEGVTRENGVMLDRLFLKDILRRLSISGTDPKVEITEEGVAISTPEFDRLVPITNSKGNVNGISFKIKASVFQSMIVGDDSNMSENLFLYFEKARRGVGYQLTLSDDTGVFLANTNVA